MEKCRPDWVLHNIVTGEFRVADYKSRPLGLTTPSRYERYAVVINAITIGDDLEYRLGRKDLEVTAQLLYGDGKTAMVRYTEADADDFMRFAAEAASHLFLRGEFDSPKTLISSTRLAAMLAELPEQTPGGEK